MSITGEAFAIIAPFGDSWYQDIAWHRHNQPTESTPVSLAEVSEVTQQALGTDYGCATRGGCPASTAKSGKSRAIGTAGCY